MKAILIFALLVAVLLIAGGIVYAADKCDYRAGNVVCATCNAPAWNRAPVAIYPTEISGAGPGRIVQTDPWVSPCGAFCSAGQLSPGWPYGWDAPYWLRPNSNY